MTLIIARPSIELPLLDNIEASIRQAKDLGADWVELYVRRTADGLAAVCHNAHLPDGRPVSSVRAEELPTYVPNLLEVLEVCSDMGVAIQVRNLPEDPDFDQDNIAALAVAGLVGAYLGSEQVVVSSYNIDDVNRVQAEDPTIPVALVCGFVEPAWALRRALDHEMSAVHVYESMCTPPFVEYAHEDGLEVWVRVVNEAEKMVKLADMGIDGIVTDYPDIARATIG